MLAYTRRLAQVDQQRLSQLQLIAELNETVAQATASVENSEREIAIRDDIIHQTLGVLDTIRATLAPLEQIRLDSIIQSLRQFEAEAANHAMLARTAVPQHFLAQHAAAQITNVAVRNHLAYELRNQAEPLPSPSGLQQRRVDEQAGEEDVVEDEEEEEETSEEED